MASEGARSVLHSERRSGWHCLMVRLVRKSRDAAVDVLHDRLRVKHPWCVCGSAHALDRARVRAHDGAPGHFRKIHLADSPLPLHRVFASRRRLRCLWPTSW